jgi:protein-L-isoaspartate(D-aspartate) O-methyltransferase
LTLADVALVPFVRQFANTDQAWFDIQNLPNVQRWLEGILASELFSGCMVKHEQWQSPNTQDEMNPLVEATIAAQPTEPAEMSKARQEMVEQQLLPRGISDPRVISAMSKTPRHLFLPDEAWSEAYRDYPLAIESGQTISQPFIVALMSELLSPLPAGAKVMEIGTGCGYQTAVLVALGYEVHSIERISGLSLRARKTLGEIDSLPSELLIGDGMLGNPAGAPYDAIISTACARRVPAAWIDQVVEGGLIITPVKRLGGKQYLMRYTKHANKLLKEDLGLVRFVPLLRGVDES